MAEEQKDREEGSKSRDLDIRREYPIAPGAYYGHQEDEIHIRDYLQVILRRKWIVITFFIAVVTTEAATAPVPWMSSSNESTRSR